MLFKKVILMFMISMEKISITGLLILIVINKIDGLCTFPTDLRGDWISADRDIVTLTSNTLSNYSIELSVALTSVDFDCETFQNDQYYLRGTTTFTVFSDVLRPHICMEFQNVTSDKFYYFIVTKVETTVNEMIHVAKDSDTVTHSDVCNRPQPYEVGTYIMLIRDGASASSLAITCPSDILRTFENVHMITADGTSNCSGSKLDTCTYKQIMNYTYNSCGTDLTFSAGGSWKCLYYAYSGSTTYLAALNLDTTVIATQTYRIVCYTFQWHDTTLMTTVYPGSCRQNQTASYVISPGVVMTMSDVSEDRDNDFLVHVEIKRRSVASVPNNLDPDYGFDMVPYYVGAVSFVLLILGCVGVCVNYRHFKNADKPNRIHTIKVKEMDKEQHRESTSGIFSCSSTSIEEMDFRSTSTPVPKPRVRQKITSPPTSLTGVLQTHNTAILNNQKVQNNIYDDVHYTFIGQGHLKKTSDVQTSEDFYINYSTYPYKEIPLRTKGNNRTMKTNAPNNRTMKTNAPRPKWSDNFNLKSFNKNKQNDTATSEILNDNKDVNQRPSYNPVVSGSNIVGDGPSANPVLSGKSIVKEGPSANPVVSGRNIVEDGPSARGRGDITNSVHYFDRRIPMHWK